MEATIDILKEYINDELQKIQYRVKNCQDKEMLEIVHDFLIKARLGLGIVE